MSSTTGELIQISNMSIREFSLSPDGQTIVFQYGTDDVDLYSITLNQTSLSRLTFSAGFESSPIWSPDGLMVAYLYGDMYGYYDELRILTLENKNTYTLLKSDTDLGQFDWSPDGEKISFTYGNYECTNIYEISLSNQNIEQLTNLPGCTFSPNWSLDGKWLLFTLSNFTTGNWWDREWNIYALYNEQVRPLITGIDSWPSYPKISPVPYLENGKTCTITKLGINQELFISASLIAEVTDYLTEGENIMVISGPVDTEGYYWWLVRTQEGVEGWVRDIAGWYSCEDE